MNTSALGMISIPIASYNEFFKAQLDFFWYQHKRVYGEYAKVKALPLIVKRNLPDQPKQEVLDWDIDVPHVMCESCFDCLSDVEVDPEHTPLNILTSLMQVLDNLEPEQLIEILDCDMCHIKQHPLFEVGDDEIYADTIYEDWHLKSLTENKYVIECYFLNGGGFYNGGFVPLVSKVKTIKKIINDWLAIQIHIQRIQKSRSLCWWSGMFALSAACERNKIQMKALNVCYVPGLMQQENRHYVAHYSVDEIFNKRRFPFVSKIDSSKFPKNIFYDAASEWMQDYLRKYPE